MSTAAESLDGEPTGESTTPEEYPPTVGVVTRAISWLLDWAAINLVAIFTGIGVALLLSIFPLAKNLKPAFEAIAGGVYIIWCAAYFVAFWSLTGQTLGARMMQIRLVTSNGGRVKPARALVRWVGMNLSMLLFCAGYVPILFGRRGLPDWLAKTLVLEAQQMSLAEGLLAARRTARDGSSQRSRTTLSDPGSSSFVSDDGLGAGAGLAEPSEPPSR